MAYRVGHGGGCCGVNHIRDAGTLRSEEELDNLIRGTRQGATKGMLVEIVLTNRQCQRRPELPVMIQRKGFKLVSRFLNPNSGNICNVFHYNRRPRSLTARLPFPIVEANEE